MRYYSNIATGTTLTAGVASSATVLSLAGVSGLPTTYPFTLSVDVGTDSEEIVTCTSLTGLDATVVRGEDGTAATAHSAGAVVRHMMSARDLREPQDHIAASTGVHGLAAGDSMVGTTSTQTLSGKTLDGASNTFTNIPKSALPTDVVYAAGTQTLSDKTIDGSVNTISNIVQSALPLTSVSTDGVQTLSNKTIDGGSNTLSNIALASVPGLGFSKCATGSATTVTFTTAGSQSPVTITTLNVTHGLGTTPSVVLVTPTNAYTNTYFLASVNSKNSTTFQIQVWSAGAATTGSCTVDWIALA